MPIMMNNSSYMNNIKTLYHFQELLSRLIWATTRLILTFEEGGEGVSEHSAEFPGRDKERTAYKVRLAKNSVYSKN